MPAPRRLIAALPWMVAGSLVVSTALSHAQPAQPGTAPKAATAPQAAAPSIATASPANNPSNPASKPLVKPLWSELSAKEQAALKPLAANWDGLSIGQKRKWISVSKDFDRLPPAEQSKVHARMTDWTTLSPQQRASARQNFAQNKELTDGLTPEQRKVQWQAYQQLSAEEKRKLAENAGRPAMLGAAPAAKPQPVLKKEPAPQFGTAKVLAKARAASAAQTSSNGKIAVAPHVQQQGAVLPGHLPAESK
jgi:hypothetical protein